VKALYKNRLCTVIDGGPNITLDDDGRQFTVDFSDGRLVVDPTDSQVADADNLGQWYGYDDKATNDVRAMLRGDLSPAEWEARKGSSAGKRL
jgi:hypothetical protein